jgi:hypothetical protein
MHYFGTFVLALWRDTVIRKGIVPYRNNFSSPPEPEQFGLFEKNQKALYDI